MNDSSPILAFWRVVAREFGVGVPLLKSLEQALVRVHGTELEPVAASLIAQVRSGQTLSGALAQHPDVFGRAQQAMVRAGEVGGVLDVCIRRLVDGLAEGSLSPAGKDLPLREQLALYWWALGCMLSSGVPVLDALDVAGEGASSEQLRQAIARIRQDVQNGCSMAEPMRRFVELFPRETCDAIAAAEQTGAVDSAAMRIGDELKARTAGSVPPAVAAKEGEANARTCDAPGAAGNDPGERARHIANAIVLQSLKDKASDIHFDPADDGGGRIRYRIDGVLWEMMPPPPPLFPLIVNRIKVMAGMDVAQSRLPQTGSIRIKTDDVHTDLRVSTLPAMHGERLVVRILHGATLVDLKSICGEAEDKLGQLRALCRLPNGLVICSGPSGSGKTTLLYAMVKELDCLQQCVISIEDPIEFTLPGVVQIPVKPQAGMTFSNALRHVLRQDPDVLVLGEVRDLEALQAAVVAANTGHLVLTSIHAGTAPGTLKRMLDAGLEPFMVNSAVAGVVSQRLVRQLCPNCRQKAEPALHSLPPEAVQMVQRAEGAAFYAARPKGCPDCHETGYGGRIGLHEILVMSEAVRTAIAGGADLAAIRKAAIESGMRTLLMDGIRKAAAGLTSIDEVMRAVPVGWE